MESLKVPGDSLCAARFLLVLETAEIIRGYNDIFSRIFTD
jgi:hypothetical protein